MRAILEREYALCQLRRASWRKGALFVVARHQLEPAPPPRELPPLLRYDEPPLLLLP